MQSEIGVRLTANTDSLRQGVQNAKFLMEDLGNSAKVANAGVTPPMAGNVDNTGITPNAFFGDNKHFKELLIAIQDATQALKQYSTGNTASAYKKSCLTSCAQKSRRVMVSPPL